MWSTFQFTSFIAEPFLDFEECWERVSYDDPIAFGAMSRTTKTTGTITLENLNETSGIGACKPTFNGSYTYLFDWYICPRLFSFCEANIKFSHDQNEFDSQLNKISKSIFKTRIFNTCLIL